MNCSHLRWTIAVSLLAFLVTGCGESSSDGGGGTGATAGAGGTGGTTGVGGSGGTAGSGGAAGTGGTGGQTIVISDEVASPRTLSRRFVKDAANRDAVCNDGTDAAYYFDAGSGSGRGQWIIHLQGGASCGNPQACLDRAQSSPWLTSSASYPDTLSRNGLFAADLGLNPDFFDWNAVYIGYCSSDTWRGSKAATEEEGGFHFRGHDIIRAVLEDLQDAADFGTDNLVNATAVILSGTSAGGNGVKQNLDRVAEMLAWADVRGLDDSAFWSREAMGGSPLDPGKLSERAAYQGFVFDDSCAVGEPDPALCANSMVVALNHVTTPYFVVMDQIDLVIIGAAVDQTPERIDAIAESARVLVRDHGAGFAPRYGNHGWLADPLSYQYEIDDLSVLDSFGNWYFDRAGPALVVQEP
ncbi:MAG: hypothetical protein JRH14_01230 [Deltaproteobacteria bacterium]|nr:hypothetical protein [Deltaproteobacteria bacterium]